MAHYSLSPGPENARAYGWQSVKKTRYRRVYAAVRGGSDSPFKQLEARSSLRAKRSNPFFLSALRWIASLRSQ
jgi:hypothetical protein